MPINLSIDGHYFQYMEDFVDNTGIYILYWDINKPYIGQTTQFNTRKLKHLNEIRKGTHCNYKILEEYKKYNSEPTIDLMCKCTVNELNEYEEFFIKDFDSISNGLNIISGGYSVGKGINNPSSKYSEDQLLKVFNMLSEVTNSYKHIALTTGVALSTVKKIGQGVQHTWLQSRLPEIYSKILAISYKDRFSNSSSAGAKNIEYRKIRSPDGKTYTVTNTLKFSKEHNLPNGNLCLVLSGKRKSVLGWYGIND